jgi:hypothetical protein
MSHPGEEGKDGVFEAHLPVGIGNRMISKCFFTKKT